MTQADIACCVSVLWRRNLQGDLLMLSLIFLFVIHPVVTVETIETCAQLPQDKKKILMSLFSQTRTCTENCFLCADLNEFKQACSDLTDHPIK